MKNSLKTRFTKPQLDLQKHIEKEIGLETILEYPADKFFLDIYCPEINCGVEYDGPFHHKNKDIKRDAIILETCKIKIFRITDLKDKDQLEELKKFLME